MTYGTIIDQQNYRSRYFITGSRNGRKRLNHRSNNAYHKIDVRVKPMLGFGSDYLNSYAPEFTPIPLSTTLNNKLYGKLREEVIGPKGELLTSAVEWKSSLGMITKRALLLGSAFLALKRFKFKEVARLLGTNTPRKLKKLSKKRAQTLGLSPTELWLEYWMGWAPLCGDIAHAIKTLTASRSSTRHFRVGVRHNDTLTDITKSWSKETRPKEYWQRIVTSVSSHSYGCYGDIVAVNHNYGLANQLGFTNPALTAWQILPFSFMVDWFANVATVIGSLTDFLGVSFANTGNATKSAISVSVSYVEVSSRWVNDKSELYVKQRFQNAGTSTVLSRLPGPLPTPRLNIVMLDKLSLTRAATSVSLLREIFLRK